MPYGLVNAPSIFQDFMHEVLRDFLHKSVLVYIDDILIYSRSMADHQRHVAEVLHRLRTYHLFLKAEKCVCHQPSVQFLGYVIDHSGVCMDKKKVAAVRDWPTPTSVKDLQRFLGFANFYRRFIKDYSFITIHPDPQLPFVVEVDASTTGVGAVLSQQQGNPRKLHPCAFFLRKLNPVEVNYDIGTRELLTVKLALEEWRHWLEGAKHPFAVFTDHKNLEYLQAAKRLNPRQSCWALFFTRFHFTISYRPGSKNVKADTLSRIHSLETINEDLEPILPEKLFASPISWSEETLPEPNSPADAPPGCPQGLQFVPWARHTTLVHSSHTSLGTGHPGINGTLSLLTQCFWWLHMAADVRRYVQGCRECAMSKSPRHLPSGKLLPLPFPYLDNPQPWTRQSIYSTTYSDTTGYPEDIVSDRGPQFTSRVWRAFFNRLGVTVSLSSGYHPQTNGQTERKIQEVGHFLRTFCHSHQESWSQFLGWVEYAQNLLRQPTTGLTRFQCVLGYQPPVPLGWGAIGRSGCGLLVPGEREGLGLGTPTAPAGTTQAQDDSGPSAISSTRVPARTE
ncbi:hypothetical protein QTP86_019906 [Hemibagrus guttatus]|nr:hypothetical protein QTP86_019906 [Hemibagrus guttatus]